MNMPGFLLTVGLWVAIAMGLVVLVLILSFSKTSAAAVIGVLGAVITGLTGLYLAVFKFACTGPFTSSSSAIGAGVCLAASALAFGLIAIGALKK